MVHINLYYSRPSRTTWRRWLLRLWLNGLERRLRGTDRGALIASLLLTSFLGLTILYPIVLVVYEAFTFQGSFSLVNFQVFLGYGLLREALLNSILVALASVVGTTILGIPMAYLLTRYEFRGKSLFQILASVPLIAPPFVGALGLQLIFGRGGIINNLLLYRLLHWVDQPPDWLYSLTGVVFIETIHLFPIVFLTVSAALSRLDPSMEESAENLGAGRFRVFRTVIFPLVRPGYMAGAILVFIWSLSDLGTPLMLGGEASRLLAVQAFFRIQATYTDLQGYVISIILQAVSIVALLLVRRYVGLREYASMFRAGTLSRTRRMGGWTKILAYAFLITVLCIAFLPDVGIFLASIVETWSIYVGPTGYTLANYREVLLDSPLYVQNSLFYSSAAALFDVAFGLLIAYLVVRKSFVGKSLLEGLTILPFAVPGIVLGLGYLRAWQFTPLDPLRLSPVPALILSYTVRRLPYTVRATHASLQQMDVSLEEASRNLGASTTRTIWKITLPLVAPGLIAGGLMAFVNAMIEVSSTLIIVGQMRYFPLTRALYEYTQNPANGLMVASAAGVLLIAVTAACLAVASRILGRSMGLVLRA